MAGPRTIRVRIAHSHELIALGIRQALQDEPLVTVLAPPAACAASLDADVIVADEATALSHLAGAPALRAGAPRHLVLGVTGGVCGVRQTLLAGVHGYVPLGCSLDELVAAVLTVGRGSRYIAQEAAQALAESALREPLTARELDVLQLLVQGAGNRAIGLRLGLAVGTVKVHMKSILGKLGARSRTQALSLAVGQGLVAPRPVAARPPRTMAEGSRPLP